MKPKYKITISDENDNPIDSLYMEQGDRINIQKKKEIDWIAKQNAKNQFNIAISELGGSFYFNNYHKLMKKLKDKEGNVDYALIFRFMYLSTYADYDGYLRYGKTKNGVDHDYMKESDFPSVLNLSKAAISNIRPLFYSNGLIKKDDVGLKINTNYCIRGELPGAAERKATRVFDDGLRYIYLHSKPTSHKRLGIVASLMPYMNIHNNIICANPYEDDLDYIQPLTLKDICWLVGFDYENAKNLKKTLTSLEFQGYGMIAFISHSKGEFFVVNPRVFFKGSSLKDLNGIAEVFNVKNKKDFATYKIEKVDQTPVVA